MYKAKLSKVAAAKTAICETVMGRPTESVHLENHCGGMSDRDRSFLFRESETHRPMSMFCVWPGMSTHATDGRADGSENSQT